jgi:hypothetical protein
MLGNGDTVEAAQEFSVGGIGLMLTKFALGAAFDAAPELARVFEVHLPAGIAEGLCRSCLALKRAAAVLAGFGFKRNREQTHCT